MADASITRSVTRLGRVLVAGPAGNASVLFAAAVALTALVFALFVEDVSWLLLGVVLIGGAVFLILQPHCAVLGMVAFWMLGIASDPLKFGPLKTVDLLALLLLIPLALEVARERQVWAIAVPQIRIMLGIGLVLVAATVWSELFHPPPPLAAYELTAVELRQFTRNFIVLMFFATFVKKPRHVHVAAGAFLLVILVFAYDALDPLGGGPGEGRAEARGIADPNRLGALCVWATALAWSFRFHSSKRLWRTLSLIPLLGFPFVALLTGSRSAFLQLLLLTGLVLLEQRHWSPAQRMRGFALVLTVAVVIVVAVPHASLLRVTSYGTEVGEPGSHSTRFRLQVALAGVVMAAENPILGVGPGNFRWRLGRYHGPHNSYIWAVTSGGPALLALYLLLLHRTHRGLRAAEQAGAPELVWLAKGLRLSVISFVFFSFFADVWLQPPFCWLVGMSIALGRHVPSTTGVPVRAVSVGSAAPRPA